MSRTQVSRFNWQQRVRYSPSNPQKSGSEVRPTLPKPADVIIEYSLRKYGNKIECCALNIKHKSSGNLSERNKMIKLHFCITLNIKKLLLSFECRAMTFFLEDTVYYKGHKINNKHDHKIKNDISDASSHDMTDTSLK